MHRIQVLANQIAPAPAAPARVNTTAAALYTKQTGGVLTAEQRAFYEEHGYILVKNLVPQHRLNVYAQRFLDIVNGRVEKQATMLMMRDVTVAKQKGMGEQSITKLQDFMDDEVLFQYCAEPAVLAVVESIVGADVKAMHTMLINKPPDTGKGSSRHPPHQDLWYFPFRPAEKIVASWTAMQHIDETNGCLFVVPGSHTGQLLKHEYPSDGIVNKAYHGIQNSSEADTKSMVNIVMESGDTVFFHPLLIHGSGRNNSSGFRKAISCHFAACDCHYIDVKGSMQDDIAKEIEHMAKSKGGMSISFNDVWRFKGRLVAGKEGEF